MDCVFEAPIPPLVADHEIDLLELYKMILDMGGSNEITKKNQWEDISLNFGLPDYLKDRFRGIYERYLDLPNAYYRAVIDDPEEADQSGCKDESAKTTYREGRGKDAADDCVQEADREEAGQGIEAWIKNVAQEVADKAKATKPEKENTSKFEHVRILHDDGNNLIITLDEDSEPEDEEDPSEDNSVVDPK